MGYCTRAAGFTLKNGVRLAAGCICSEETADICLERLEALKENEFNAKDLVEIDFEAAIALCSIFRKDSKYNPKVIAAGCSIEVSDARIPYGMTTGGVLGDPDEDPVSSEDEIEQLNDGFNMMTLSGSPGLAADTDKGTINIVLQLIKKMREENRLKDPAVLDEMFNTFHISTAILVMDGTGSGTGLFLAVKDNDGTRIYT